jgi:hypothetical protein
MISIIPNPWADEVYSLAPSGVPVSRGPRAVSRRPAGRHRSGAIERLPHPRRTR